MRNKLLIIDDEVGTLFAIKKVLEEPAVEIDTEPTFEGAIRLISEKTYNAVITDLSLPGSEEMAGYEIIRQIRNQQPKTKIIVITAHGGEEMKAKVLAMGADYFLEKPVSPTSIRFMLRSMGMFIAAP
jgi:DNA-binding response OmpR family regulator